MSQPVAMLPCPFCEGPPVPIVQNAIPGGCAPLLDLYPDGGLYVDAFVFCHECGAEGSHSRIEFLYTRADYFEAEADAVRLWNLRDGRNRACFDGGVAEGLNLYPRPET